MDRVIRKYNGIVVSKKEYEVVEFIQTGSNNFWDSYYQYNERKLRIDRPTETIKSWFNRTIRALHDKGLMKEIPFVLGGNRGLPYFWANPGINASKANYQCIVMQDDFQEQYSKVNKIL